MVSISKLSRNKPNIIKFCQYDLLTLMGLLFLVTFLFFLKVDSLALFDPDEPRYAASARDMIDTGNWVVPYFNGNPRLNKPPLFYWLVALSFKAIGVSEFSARLPSLIFGIGGVVIAFLWARSMWSRWKAFCVGFILSVCPLYLSISRLCITDMTTSFFLYWGLYCFYIGYERGFHSKWNKIAIYISLAMMFLTKGHVGIVIFLLVICVFLLAVKDLKYLLNLWYAPGFIVFAGLVLPWSVMFLANVGAENVMNLISHETYDRFVGGYQHPEPFYFYANVFFFGFFPWSFFIPLAFLFAFKWRKGINSGIQNAEIVFDNREAGMRIKFFSIWFIVVLVFFSMSSSKLFTYILPMAPTVPFLFISMFSNVEFKKIRTDYALVLSIFLLLFVFSLFTLVFLSKWISFRYLTSSKIDLMSWMFCICMALTVVVFIVKGIEWAKCVLGFTAYCLLLFITLNLHIFMGENRSTRSLVKECLPLDRDSYALFCYRKILPSLAFYTGKTVEVIEPGKINSLHSLEIDNRDVYPVRKKIQPSGMVKRYRAMAGYSAPHKLSNGVYIYMKRKDYKKCKNDVNESDFYLIGENDAAVILKKVRKMQNNNSKW